MEPLLNHYTSGDWVLIIGAAATGIAAVIGAVFTGLMTLRQVPKIQSALRAQTSLQEKQTAHAEAAEKAATEKATVEVDARDVALVKELLDVLKERERRDA